MRGFVDAEARELVAGDTIIDPHTGVLCRIDSVEDNGAALAIHMRGSVSQSYAGLVVKHDRVLRRQPRMGAPVAVEMTRPDPVASETVRQSCACGAKNQAECLRLCLKG